MRFVDATAVNGPSGNMNSPSGVYSVIRSCVTRFRSCVGLKPYVGPLKLSNGLKAL